MGARSIGPYRVVGTLGAGGMGEVFLAEDTRLGRKVALKRPSDRYLASPEARQRLQREARVVAKFNHPHIAAIYDVLDDDDRPCIVMEYVDGRTLSTVLKDGPLPVERALEIGVQIADALTAAHQHGVVHRDLKPANVCLTAGGQVKVLDFGIARALPAAGASEEFTAVTSEGQIVGTPGYMAPEQLMGYTGDERSDLFSFGVVLFELLTGHPPYEQANRADRALAMLTGPVPSARAINPAVPETIDRLVQQAMSRTPDGRPLSAAAMKRELDAAVRQFTTQPTELASSARPTPARSSRARLIWLFVAAAIVAAAFVWPTTRAWLTGSRAGNGPVTVAVLPFKSTPTDADADSYGSAVADMLLSDLAGTPGVRTVSRADAFGYRDPTSDLPKTARELGATHVVYGAVSQMAGAVTFVVRLTSTLSPANPAWSRTYQGATTDLVSIKQKAAADLADALELPAEARPRFARAPTTDALAVQNYAQARAALDRKDVPGNVARAINLFEGAIARDKQFALAHAGLGEAYWQDYQATHAEDTVKKATNAVMDALLIDNNLAEVHYTLGLILAGTNRADKAIEEYQRSLAINPTDSAHRALGELLAAAGKMDEALVQFDHAIELRPLSFQNYTARGGWCLRTGRYDLAKESILKAIDLQPDSDRGYQLLGTYYLTRGETELARVEFEKSIARAPNAVASSNLGLIHYQAGRFAEAATAFEQAIRIRPRDVVYHRNLGDTYRRLGRSADAHAEYQKVIDFAQADLAVNASNASALSLAALCEAKIGQFAKAKADVARALAMRPASSEILYRQAAVLALANDVPRALEALQKALDAGSSVAILREDDDFMKLRGKPEFETLVNRPPKDPSKE